jgi:hypothetical protein
MQNLYSKQRNPNLELRSRAIRETGRGFLDYFTEWSEVYTKIRNHLCWMTWRPAVFSLLGTRETPQLWMSELRITTVARDVTAPRSMQDSLTPPLYIHSHTAWWHARQFDRQWRSTWGRSFRPVRLGIDATPLSAGLRGIHPRGYRHDVC